MTMNTTYTIQLFASLKEKLGPEITFQGQESMTAGALLDQFFAEHSAFDQFRHVSRLAVDCAFVSEDTQIQSSQSLALIPPVSGG